MAEFTLPDHSKVVKGKEWARPGQRTAEKNSSSIAGTRTQGRTRALTPTRLILMIAGRWCWMR